LELTLIDYAANYSSGKTYSFSYSLLKYYR
jgi:hypothetical protein